jgi:antisense regulator of RalR protein
MYKITATIHKPGGLPVEWLRMSKEELTPAQCERMFSQSKEAGKTAEERVLVKNFKCVACKKSLKAGAKRNGK